MSADDVLEFWFQQCRPWQWFRRRDSFDALVRERFGEAVERALAGELDHWSCGPSSGLALVLPWINSPVRSGVVKPRLLPEILRL